MVFHCVVVFRGSKPLGFRFWEWLASTYSLWKASWMFTTVHMGFRPMVISRPSRPLTFWTSGTFFSFSGAREVYPFVDIAETSWGRVDGVPPNLGTHIWPWHERKLIYRPNFHCHQQSSRYGSGGFRLRVANGIFGDYQHNHHPILPP